MFAILAGAAGLGCKDGKAGSAQQDGGGHDAGDGSIGPDVSTPTVQAFDVIAVLNGDPQLPATSSFTLVVDRVAGRVIVGGNGRGAVIAATSTDGKTFHVAGDASIGSNGTSACDGLSSVAFSTLDFSVADRALTGTAAGMATISCGDCAFQVPFTATLNGSPDTTAPRAFGAGISPSSPFDGFGLFTSEPLPASATARLVGTDGVGIDLIPTRVEGAIPIVVGFSKPDVILPAGQGYNIALGGLVDFAGNAGASDAPVRFTSFPEAPLVPEDGFESATGTSLGGAMVVTSGPLPVISGSKSLYFGTVGAPGLDSAFARSLMVRLTRQPGDTKLRFSYRVVAADSWNNIPGQVRVGSVGGAAGSGTYPNPVAGEGQKITVGSTQVTLSGLGTADIDLPSDAKDEVLVAIIPNNFACSPFRANAGVLIDDLRLD